MYFDAGNSHLALKLFPLDITTSDMCASQFFRVIPLDACQNESEDYTHFMRSRMTSFHCLPQAV